MRPIEALNRWISRLRRLRRLVYSCKNGTHLTTHLTVGRLIRLDVQDVFQYKYGYYNDEDDDGNDQDDDDENHDEDDTYNNDDNKDDEGDNDDDDYDDDDYDDEWGWF